MVVLNGILIMLIINTLMGKVLLVTIHCYCSPEVVHMYPCMRALKAKQIVV